MFDFGGFPSGTQTLFLHYLQYAFQILANTSHFVILLYECDCNDSRFPLMTCCLIETERERESLSVTKMQAETCQI